jgi:hypothetical protein
VVEILYAFAFRCEHKQQEYKLKGATVMNYVEEIKDIIRKSSGARDFVSRAYQSGWQKFKEDFIGLYLQKGDCTVILAVLPSHGPDLIWCLSMASKGSDTVNLIDEGKLTF